jgi:uncharacterized protein (TIGR00730 family)
VIRRLAVTEIDDQKLDRQPDAVCVYCASSRVADPVYRELAHELGGLLALAGRTLVYGGSREGSMGALADGALDAGGRVVGVMPGFLQALEIAHDRLSELHIVSDLRERKQWMLCRASAVIALPGGTGTFEELLEALTLKRLGIFLGPIVICNQRAFYDPLLTLLEAAIEERFMVARHRDMWTVVETAAEAVAAIAQAPAWPADALRFAAP